MGCHLSSWKHYGILRLWFPRRYVTNEGSSSLGYSADGSWDLESACKGLLSVRYDAVGGVKKKTACSTLLDGRGALGESCAVHSDSPHCDAEKLSKRKDEARRLQDCPKLFRAVPSLSDLLHPKKYHLLDRFFRIIHISSFAAKFPSGVDTAMPNGIHERTTTAERPSLSNHGVKKINDILCHEDWERALEQLNIHLSVTLVCEVIRRQSNVDASFAFFQWTKEQQGYEHSRRSYKAMLQKLMSRQDFKSRNLETFKLILNESLQRGWSPGVTIHTYLIDGYCKLGQVNVAFYHFDEMISHGCAPNVVTYSSLIGGLMKAGRVEDALNLLDEMEEKKCHPNVITYSVLINGLIKHQAVDKACKIFDRMKKQGCMPNLITYSCLIDGVAREGKFEEVSNLLDQMRETGCLPNIFIYGTVINYFVKAGKPQRAWDLFAEMKQNGLEPNLFVYTPLIGSLGKSGTWVQAQEFLEEMKLRGCAPDVITYSALVAGLVQAWKWEEAFLVLNEMEANGCQPNEVTYTVLIDGLVKARQADRAEALFKKMVAKGCTPTIYTEDAFQKVLAKIGARKSG